MHKALTVLLLFFILPCRLKSQILPKDGSTLYYRLIGFSFPPVQKATKYRIEIAAGNYDAEDSFKKNIIKSIETVNDKIIAEVPSFGSQYTWRTAYTGNDSKIMNSEFYHFSTAILPEVDTNSTRLRITRSAEKYKDDYVFLDGNKAIYDMNGYPVWCLPDIPGVKTAYSYFDDLKMTPQATITFINNEGRAYEVNYNGDILWSGPDNAVVNKYTCYHHEFTRLSNGHYMILGMEPVFFRDIRPAKINDDILIDGRDKINTNPAFRKADFGTVIEYDEKGNIVWTWKTSKYLLGSDLYYHIPGIEHSRYDVHENSFYFDEKNKVIYVGLRNISRIVKVQYPSGKVLANYYGEIYKPRVAEKGNDLFCLQHSCRRSQKGYLYLYNNNVCKHAGNLPKVIMMQEPSSKNGRLKKIWEYTCTIEDTAIRNRNYPEITTGGNVIELPGDALFVSMSSQYSKLFIVTLGKKVLWSALPEQWNKMAKKWEVAPQYRASIITRKELEKLVWNGEGAK